MEPGKDRIQNRFLFLDRDGTLIEEKHYLCDPEDVKLCENVAEGLKLFQSLGFSIVVVTNQSGIGRGYYGVADMHAVHQRIQDLLHFHEIKIEHFLFCPHKPEDNCLCRKPELGLLEEFSEYQKEVAKDSVMIGDKACDIEFGLRAGMLAILVRTGYGSKYDFEEDAIPHFTARDLLDAANWMKRNHNE